MPRVQVGRALQHPVLPVVPADGPVVAVELLPYLVADHMKTKKRTKNSMRTLTLRTRRRKKKTLKIMCTTKKRKLKY
jgi:hypothetical protein